MDCGSDIDWCASAMSIDIFGGKWRDLTREKRHVRKVWEGRRLVGKDDWSVCMTVTCMAPDIVTRRGRLPEKKKGDRGEKEKEGEKSSKKGKKKHGCTVGRDHEGAVPRGGVT